MISLYILLAIAVIHWVADFILQTRWQALNKSHNFNALMGHTLTYSGVWFAWVAVYCNYLGMNWFNKAAIFWMITLILHSITDLITSQLTSYFFGKKDYHNGFVIVGLDQMLHYAQLIWLYKVLIEK